MTRSIPVAQGPRQGLREEKRRDERHEQRHGGGHEMQSIERVAELDVAGSQQ